MNQGAAIAIVIGVLLLAWLGPFAMAIQMEWETQKRKKHGEPLDYDERQRLARQRAGNHALYALMGFLALWAVVDQFGWFAWTGVILDMVLCAMMLTWCVWSSECIWSDAFITWKNKQLSASGLAMYWGTLILTNTNTLRSIGILETRLPLLFACGSLAALCVMVLCKRWRDKRQDTGDGAV